VARIRISN